MAGSHSVRRKEPEDYSKNTYWYPLSLEPVRNLLNELSLTYQQVILFGEVYGMVQKKYHYDAKGKLGFRVFDLLVDGKYLDFEVLTELCVRFDVERVPTMGGVKYSLDNVAKYVESFGHSLMSEEHPMEGAVIKPFHERHNEKIGRVILKYISNAYLFDKGGSDFKDE
jgi:ATP-dependent RNA circularization protein (DNA/RNA ligase family)